MNNPLKFLPALAMVAFSAAVLSLSIVAVREPYSQTAAVNAGQQIDKTPTVNNYAVQITSFTKDQTDSYICQKCTNSHALASFVNHGEVNKNNWLAQLIVNPGSSHVDTEKINKSTWKFYDGTTIIAENHSNSPDGYPVGTKDADGNTQYAVNTYSCSGDPVAADDPYCVNYSDHNPANIPSENSAFGDLEFTTAMEPPYKPEATPDMPFSANPVDDTYSAVVANAANKVSPKLVPPAQRRYSLIVDSKASLGLAGDAGDYYVTLQVLLTAYHYEMPPFSIPVLHYRRIECGNISVPGQKDSPVSITAVEPGKKAINCTVKVRVSASPTGQSMNITPREVGGDVTKTYYIYDIRPISGPVYIPSNTQASSNRFSNNDTVSAIDNLNVRDTPALSGATFVTETAGARGRIIGGPVVANGYTWWKIAWSNGLLGWSAQSFLTKILPTYSPAATPVTTPTPAARQAP